MVMTDEVVAKHEMYMNHLLRCKRCYAPRQIHCEEGVSARVAYVAEYAFSLEARQDRRSLMIHEKARNAIEYQLLDAAVRARLESENG